MLFNVNFKCIIFIFKKLKIINIIIVKIVEIRVEMGGNICKYK